VELLIIGKIFIIGNNFFSSDMKVFTRNTIILLGLIVLDQLTKLFFEKTRSLIDLKIVAFHFVTNTGASWGILQGKNLLLIWISLIVLGAIMMSIDLIRKRKEQVLPVILIVAGLLGNLIDRIFRGFVVDFIDFRFWPVFNLADSCVVIGVIWLIIVILKNDYEDKKEIGKKQLKRLSTELGPKNKFKLK
jgi:signal peptidase II